MVLYASHAGFGLPTPAPYFGGSDHWFRWTPTTVLAGRSWNGLGAVGRWITLLMSVSPPGLQADRGLSSWPMGGDWQPHKRGRQVRYSARRYDAAHTPIAVHQNLIWQASMARPPTRVVRC